MKVGIYGGSGFAGMELVRLLSTHPKIGDLSVSSRGYAGQRIDEVYPQLAVDQRFVEPGEIWASGLDVAFVAYPHNESAGVVKALLDAGTTLVVDLSADFRLPDVSLYEEWYGGASGAGAYRRGVLRVAGGLRAGGRPDNRKPRLLSDGGYSGARADREADGWLGTFHYGERTLGSEWGRGQAERTKTGFVTANENANAYGAPLHRHTPEIETMLRRVGEAPAVTFVPHLIPTTRGELETIVVDADELPSAGGSPRMVRGGL